MLPPGIENLTRQLRNLGRHITIETAGTVFREVECDLMSISPKLANSTPAPDRAGDWSRRHELTRINLPVLRSLTAGWDFQLKFVVASPADVPGINQLLEQLPGLDRQRVLLMPEGTETGILDARMEWLEPLCRREGFRACPRMHIHWYGNRRGT